MQQHRDYSGERPGKRVPHADTLRDLAFTISTADRFPPAPALPTLGEALGILGSLPFDTAVMDAMQDRLTVAFGRIGRNRGAQDLVEGLFAGEARERRLAAWSAFALAADPSRVSDVLARALAAAVKTDQDFHTGLVSLLALVRLGPPSDAVRATLQEAPAQQWPLVRALRELFLRDNADPNTVRYYHTALRRAVQRTDETMVQHYFGSSSPRALPAEHGEQFREAAALVVKARTPPANISPGKFLLALSTILRQGPADARAGALLLAEQLGPSAAPLAGQLTELLRSADQFESFWSARVLYLNRNTPEVQRVCPAVISFLRDESPCSHSRDTRLEMLLAEVVASGGLDRPGAVEALGTVIRAAPEPGAIRALAILERHRSEAAPAVPDLIHLLNDESRSDEARCGAAAVLAVLGRSASAARPDLMKIAVREGGVLRKSALRALRRIPDDEDDG